MQSCSNINKETTTSSQTSQIQSNCCVDFIKEETCAIMTKISDLCSMWFSKCINELLKNKSVNTSRGVYSKNALPHMSLQMGVSKSISQTRAVLLLIVFCIRHDFIVLARVFCIKIPSKPTLFRLRELNVNVWTKRALY